MWNAVWSLCSGCICFFWNAEELMPAKRARHTHLYTTSQLLIQDRCMNARLGCCLFREVYCSKRKQVKNNFTCLSFEQVSQSVWNCSWLMRRYRRCFVVMCEIQQHLYAWEGTVSSSKTSLYSYTQRVEQGSLTTPDSAIHALSCHRQWTKFLCWF